MHTIDARRHRLHDAHGLQCSVATHGTGRIGVEYLTWEMKARNWIICDIVISGLTAEERRPKVAAK